MSKADSASAERTCSGASLTAENFLRDSIIKAAAAAAWGAEAEVPKKLGKSSLSIFVPPNFTVVFTPLGAAKSGLFLITPLTGVPPIDEKEAMEGTPLKAGVLVYNTAPTAIAPSAFAWPTIVEVPMLYSLMVASPLKIMYFKLTFPEPDALLINMLVLVFSVDLKESISMGSPPILFRLKPNRGFPS